jgi:hypothetical protein
MPGLKYLPEAQPSGQHSFPPGPSQPTSSFGHAPSYSILVRRLVKHDGAGVNVVVSGPVFECQRSSSTSVVVVAAETMGRIRSKRAAATCRIDAAILMYAD